jgi:hypothetical protein
MVVPLPSDWGGHGAVYAQLGDPPTLLRWTRYQRQVGWKSAGAHRPSQWKDILEEMERHSLSLIQNPPRAPGVVLRLLPVVGYPQPVLGPHSGTDRR